VRKIIKNEFFAVVEPIEREVYDEAVALGFDGDIRDLDMAWIEEFFDEYNPVTKYVFSNELERKESRLFEALVASVMEKTQSYATAERLLVGQVEQYAIDLEDKITNIVYKDTGVEKVVWVSEHDHKRCEDCAALDGEVFNIDKAPPKQHYRCRCYLMPYTGSDK
jgi:SPP1 gp7 family putative phage head morphogenesis protein